MVERGGDDPRALVGGRWPILDDAKRRASSSSLEEGEGREIISLLVRSAFVLPDVCERLFPILPLSWRADQDRWPAFVYFLEELVGHAL